MTDYKEIRLLVTDFDGTLVDTFQANYHAYCDAFAQVGLTLSQEDYRQCYGLRFDGFMDKMGIDDAETRKRIRAIKGSAIPTTSLCWLSTARCWNSSGCSARVGD